MPRWTKLLLLVLGLLLVATLPLARQFDTGSIEGVITDDRGPLPYASIEARNLMFGDITRGESEIDGRYRIEDLRPGRYSLSVTAAGHEQAWVPRIVVERGGVSQRDVRLGRSETIPTSF